MDGRVKLTTVSACELAYILSMRVSRANHIIAIRLADNPETAKMISAVNSNLRIEIDKIKDLFVIDIAKAIEDIRENAITRPTFRKWLMHDYPLSKLKTPFPPKKLRLPAGLRSMLKEQDLAQVEEQWNSRFKNLHFTEWHESVDYYPILKP